MNNYKDYNNLLDILPQDIQDALNAIDFDEVCEIVLDIGRPLEVRYLDNTHHRLPEIIGKGHIEHCEKYMGKFDRDNRTGVDATLHRISRIEGKKGNTIGLTLRVGRIVEGSHIMLEDILSNEKSILIIGRPGVGKTSMLRSASKFLANVGQMRVVIVDTSDEITGSGDLPHPAVGMSRRLPVPHNRSQYEVMLQAVENHCPDVVVVDEISSSEEVFAANTISKRGVQLLATVHGNTIEDVMNNPIMVNLLGGVRSVTISDDEAKKRGTGKSIRERPYEPAFDVVVEIVDFDEIRIWHKVSEVVDAILAGAAPQPEIRLLNNDNTVNTVSHFRLPKLPKTEVKSAPMSTKKFTSPVTKSRQHN